MVILWVNIRVRSPPSWNPVFGTMWLRFSSRLRFRTRARNPVGPRPVNELIPQISWISLWEIKFSFADISMYGTICTTIIQLAITLVPIMKSIICTPQCRLLNASVTLYIHVANGKWWIIDTQLQLQDIHLSIPLNDLVYNTNSTQRPLASHLLHMTQWSYHVCWACSNDLNFCFVLILHIITTVDSCTNSLNAIVRRKVCSRRKRIIILQIIIVTLVIISGRQQLSFILISTKDCTRTSPSYHNGSRTPSVNVQLWPPIIQHDMDRLMQERCNSIATALELHLSCTNPLICEYDSSWVVVMLQEDNEKLHKYMEPLRRGSQEKSIISGEKTKEAAD